MPKQTIATQMTASTEVQELTCKFLDKYSNELEYKTYECEEKIFRQDEQVNKMYIVKSGVFRIGQINTDNLVDTIGFRFKTEIFSSQAIIFPNSKSLFEMKSIENNLSEHNSMYEIGVEQWNAIVEKDEIFKGLPSNAFWDNLAVAFNLLKIFRKNRKTKEVYSEMYDNKHPILHSGISSQYISEFFGIPVKSLKKMYIDKQKVERAKKK